MSDIEDKRVLFLTLTYAEQVEGKEGNERLLKDFNYFIKNEWFITLKLFKVMINKVKGETLWIN